MKSPYEFLGIPQNADEMALREAYRRLARQYEGDTRRTQELNDAYDAIVLSRGQSSKGYYYEQRQDSADYNDIRRQIQHGRFDDALTLLDGMPTYQRPAEWYYLKGCAQRGRGWLEEAERNFAQAVQLDQRNSEYRAAYDQMHEDRRGNRASKRDNDSDCSCCKICAGLACLDCLCDCCN